jgi:DNA-binding CsgD family transcriptional regulator
MQPLEPSEPRKHGARQSPEPEQRLLDVLYDGVGCSGHWELFLHTLTRRYADARSMMALHDSTRKDGVALTGSQWNATDLRRYDAHYAKSNPWIPRLDRRPVGLVTFAEALVPRAELVRTECYQDFLRPARIETGIGVTLQRDGSRHMVLSLLFPLATAERDADTVGRLQRLVPHLLRVAQLERQIAELQVRAESGEAALDRLAVGMIIVDAALRVLMLNREADRIVRARDGLAIRCSVLHATVPDESRRLHGLLAGALHALNDITAAPGGVMRVTRDHICRPYEILVSPLAATTLPLGLTGRLAAVFVRDPEQRATTPAEWLQRLHGLTGAEARVVQSLLAGDSLHTAAERAQVSWETVRSQLKSVFQKTGTASQTELMRLIGTGIAAFRPSPAPAGVTAPTRRDVTTHLGDGPRPGGRYGDPADTSSAGSEIDV